MEPRISAQQRDTHVSSGEKRCNTDVGGHEHVHVCGGRLFIRTVDKEGDAEEASDEPVDLEDGGKRPHQGERGGVCSRWVDCVQTLFWWAIHSGTGRERREKHLTYNTKED